MTMFRYPALCILQRYFALSVVAMTSSLQTRETILLGIRQRKVIEGEARVTRPGEPCKRLSES